MDNLNFYYFLLPSSLQIYKEEVNNQQAISRQMFRVSPKAKNMLWILAIDSLLQFLICLNRLSHYFTERDFSTGTLRIEKYPQNQFRYTVPGQFQFFLVSSKKKKKEKKTNQTNKLTKRCNSLLLFFFLQRSFLKKSETNRCLQP